MRRFFIDPDRIKASEFYLSGREARHLRVVLRMSAGDRVILFDGTGTEYAARIASVHSDRVMFEILETYSSPTEPQIKLTIAQALLKKRKMDGIIRQLTEIGIHHWRPFISPRSIPRPIEKKRLTQTKRWETIAIEAVKQCRRSSPPTISPPVAFDDILTASRDHSTRVILWEKGTVPLVSRLPEPPFNEKMSMILMLGPEGGFSQSEVESAEKAGFATATLGPRILRAETAALTATILAMHHSGGLG